MNVRDELGQFLKSRRARLTPAEVGLQDYGERRRVPGLRREELARLAGVSVDYYVRMEQGRARGVSEEILTAVSNALRLDDAEREYLVRLARPVQPNAAARPRVRTEVQILLDAMHGVPAYVVDHRSDILAWNSLAAALLMDFGSLPRAHRNWAWLCFLDDRAKEIFVDWSGKARDTVAYLRLNAARYPDDHRLTALVGELSVKSEEFRTMWADRNVREKTFGQKRIRHPQVGEVTLTFQTMTLGGDDDQSLVAYSAEPGTDADASLRLIASWNLPTVVPADPG